MDATAYLQKAGIEEATLRNHLVRYAEQRPNESHPYFLGMCAEVVRAAAHRGQKLTPQDFELEPELLRKENMLVSRLLKYVDKGVGDGVRALSAARAFNREIYFLMGKDSELRFYTTNASFNLLIDMAFVQDVQVRGSGWYQMHGLLRRLFRNRADDQSLLRRADRVLEAYWRNRGEQGIVEAIYHTNQLNWEEGVREWVKTFDSALERSDHFFCGALVQVARELIVRNDFRRGELQRCEGNYLKSLAVYDEALRKYRAALIGLGTWLEQNPTDANTYAEKAFVFVSIGEVQVEISEDESALQSFATAISAADKSLALDGANIDALNNRGTALVGIGELRSESSRHQDALQTFERAIKDFDTALSINDTNPDAANNRGYTFAAIGQTYARIGRYADSIAIYQRAVSDYREIVRRNVNDVIVSNNMGFAFMTIGQALAELRLYNEAVNNFQEAITTFNEILRSSPDDSWVYSNRARAIIGCAKAQQRLGSSDALILCEQALASCEEALRRTPEDTWGHCSTALVLQTRAELEAEKNNPHAGASYEEAIKACNKTLQLAPGEIEALRARGASRLGSAIVPGTAKSRKQSLLAAALDDFDLVLQSSQDDLDSRLGKAEALRYLAELQLSLQEGVEYANRAREELRRLLSIAPSHARALDAKVAVDRFFAEVSEDSG